MAAAMLAPTPPTSSPTTFADFLLDANNDHYSGVYPALMTPFAISAGSATPAVVRAQVVEATAQRKAVCFMALVAEKLQAFFFPFTIKPALGVAEDLSIHNKMYAFHGEVVLGVGSLVHIPDDLFNQATSVIVPTTVNAKALLAADTTVTTFGPFIAGDADTVEVRTRKVCAIPAIYSRYLLSSEGGVTPRQFIEELLPVIEADNNNIALEPMIAFVISSMTTPTGTAPSAVLVPAPAAVPRNTALLVHSQVLLTSHLTGLKHTGGGGGVNMAPLIAAITAGQTQAADRANDDRKERQAKETKTVASMLGKEHLARLLLLCGVSDEVDLSDLWPKLASAPKASRLGVLQGMIQEEYITQGLQYEHHLPNLSFFLNLTSMIWVPFGDSLEGGSLANPFLFGDTNQEEFHSLNRQLQLVTENGAVPTLADAQALLKSKLNLPGPEESIRILRRWKVCLSVVLPRGHPLTVYISEHIEEMKSFEQPWGNYLTHEPPKYRLKGLLHLKFLMIKVTKFIHAVNRGRQLPTLDPNKISEAVLDGRRWEPIITPAFEAQYRLNHFAQLPPAGGASPPAPATPGVGRGPPPPPPLHLVGVVEATLFRLFRLLRGITARAWRTLVLMPHCLAAIK